VPSGSTLPSTSATQTKGNVVGIPVAGAKAVAVSGGALWVSTMRGASGRVVWAVQRFEPESGRLVATIAVPGVVQWVSVGEGLVWAWGGGDGAEPNGGIAAIDPASNRVVATYGWDRPFAPQSVAFAGGNAWVSSALEDQLLRLRVAGPHLQVDRVRVGRQPTVLVATAGSTLWVWNSSSGTLSDVDAAAMRVTATYQWPWGLYQADGHTIWADDGTRLVQLTPDLLADGVSVALGARLGVRAGAVSVDAGGLWVVDFGRTVLSRYARRSIEAGLLDPAARLAVSGQVEALAAGPADSLWFTTTSGDSVFHWTPANS
jgi:hypothetical protein